MLPDSLLQQLRLILPRADLVATPLPACPAISLYLFDPAAMAGPLSHDEAQAVVAEPAYWSFCWASGQVLAAYVLNQPHRVRGRTVLDFGSGSGVVAIAAAMAGASRVIACDLDPLARNAVLANAQLNGVTLEVCDDYHGFVDPVDVLVAADVLYDAENLPLLGHFRQRAPVVMLADSRVRVLPDLQYKQAFRQEARTCPDLNELEEFNQVSVYLSDACFDTPPET